MDIIRGTISYISELPLPVLLFCCAMAYILYCAVTTPKNLPLGPFAWPVIGNMWDYTRQKGPLGETFENLRETYGAIFRIYYGRQFIVVISGSDVLAEVCSKKGVFSRRPSTQWVTDRLHKQTVRHERWFTNATWFAMLKKSIDYQERITPRDGLEMKILNQIKVVKENLMRRETNGVLLGQLIDACVEDIMCDVTLGSISVFKTTLHILFPECNFPERTLPSVRVLPNVEKKALQQLILDSRSHDSIDNILTNHRDTYNADYIRDFTDLFLKIQLEREITQTSEVASYLQGLSDLFLTPPSHVTCLLQWTFLLVISHPNVQRKCQKELDVFKNGGEEEEISFPDMFRLPYIRATIFEAQRFANIMTLSSPYITTKATSVGGYSIPKDTVILIDMQPMQKDPVTFMHPEQFQPERHLNVNGRFTGLDTVIDRHVSSQLIGQLSEMITFLFFVNILREFNLNKVESDVFSLKYDRDAAPCPASYNVITTFR